MMHTSLSSEAAAREARREVRFIGMLSLTESEKMTMLNTNAM